MGPIQHIFTKVFSNISNIMKIVGEKKINRSNDLDLVLRFFKAGVKIGFLDEIIGTVLPRPGDTEVGYKAIDPDGKFD